MYSVLILYDYLAVGNGCANRHVTSNIYVAQDGKAVFAYKCLTVGNECANSQVASQIDIELR